MAERDILTGIVLIGGKSSRMGKPKYLLNYHGLPQYDYLFKMLKVICEDVYFSYDGVQILDGDYNDCMIADAEKFKNHGPISGLLSSFEKINTAILLVGCDYPLLSQSDLKYLINARDKTKAATVFINPDDHMPEPLICIYELCCKNLLLEQFANQKYSLRKFLSENFIKSPEVLNKSCLKSVDTMEEYNEIILKLTKDMEQ